MTRQATTSEGEAGLQALGVGEAAVLDRLGAPRRLGLEGVDRPQGDRGVPGEALGRLQGDRGVSQLELGHAGLAPAAAGDG